MIYNKAMARRSIFNSIGKNPFNIIRLLINLPRYVRLAYRLFMDRRVPIRPKLILLASLIYLISPLDLIPDIAFPVIGSMDDLAILILAFRYLVASAPIEAVEEHSRR